jgi:cell division protein FtsQ
MSAHPKNERREVPEAESPVPAPVVGKSVAPKKGAASTPRSRTLNKIGGIAKFVFGALIVVGCSLLVAWGAQRYMTHSPRFAISEISVSGNVRLTTDAVAVLGGVEHGANVFSIDLEAARRKIEEDPWVSSATVTRKLPGSVIIAVEEYEARALVALDGKLFLAASGGEIFKEATPEDPMDLPVITGISNKDVATDRSWVTKSVSGALDLLEELETQAFAKRYPVQELHLERDGTMEVLLGQNGIALHLGAPPYRGKLEQAERVFAELSQRKTEPSIVFLDNEASPERVVIRMR